MMTSNARLFRLGISSSKPHQNVEKSPQPDVSL